MSFFIDILLGHSVHLFFFNFSFSIQLAPVIYKIPLPSSLYWLGCKSCPDISSITFLNLHHAQDSGISNGISSSMQTTLPSANFS